MSAGRYPIFFGMPGRWRLIAKLMLWLLALFVTLIPVLGGIQTWLSYQREADSQKRTLAAVAEAFKRPLAGAVWNEDTEGIKGQLKSIVRFPGVARARLRADLGGGAENPVFDTGAPPVGGFT
ncbi:MAG: hypothetical protein WCK65_15445, partial [Rhodospirillaceae bacterium]